MRISGCFMKYTTVDKVCNGDKESLDAEDRKNCEWRLRCKAFKKFIGESGKTVGDYLVEVEDEDGEIEYEPIHGGPQFTSFCDRLIERYKSKRNRKAEYDKRKYGPSPKTMQAAAKALSARAEKRKASMADWINVFIDNFSNKLKNKRFAVAGVVIPIGQFYLIDRLDTSDYMAISYRTKLGHDTPLVRVYRKTMNLDYDVWLPFTVDELRGLVNKKDFARWKPEPKMTGRINSKIRDLSKSELAVFGETLARIVNKGQFPSEEVEK